jgi:hypothetical protein
MVAEQSVAGKKNANPFTPRPEVGKASLPTLNAGSNQIPVLSKHILMASKVQNISLHQ